MKFEKYILPVNDDKGNFLTNWEYIFPVFSVEEYNAMRTKVNTFRDKTIIYGKGNNEAELTELGEYIINELGFKYCKAPYSKELGAIDPVWRNIILGYLTNLYDVTKLLNTSLTDGVVDGSYIKFLFNSKDTYYFDFEVPVDSSYYSTNIHYNIGSGSGTNQCSGLRFGSGSFSSPTSLYCAGYLFFKIEDNRFGQLFMSGYYNYNPRNLSIQTPVDIFSSIFTNIFGSLTPEDIDPTITDPFNPGGSSGTGGGVGDFDGTSDPIDFPALPTLSSADTGFITLFNPTLDEMKNLANYMWSDLFDIATWKKLFADPMDAILGLSIVPVAVPDGGQKVVTVGNVSTGISMNIAKSQFVEVDCGTLNVNEYWGAYLDYSPYTEAELYLPYIGTHALKTDDIMGKSIHVKYHIDILSGACCAYVKCGDSILYEFVGQGSCSIPITGNDWTNVINGALTIGASVGTMMAIGGASAPMISSAASAAVNSLKPTVERSGSVSGMGGILGIQNPYLILTRPRQALPKNQNLYMGYPSFITSKLGDLSGYTEVEAVHLENIPATEAEISEIENILKDGVIF